MTYYVIHGGTAGNGNGGVTTYTLTMAVSPEGGGTTSPAVGVHTYDEGTVVDVSAAAAAGYTFDHWEDDLSGSTNPTTITMDGNKLVTAVFAVEVPPTIYTLTMIADPAVGGSTSPAVGTHVYAENTVVAVSASANPDYVFSHWSGDLAGTTNPTTVTMDSDKTVTAHFAATCLLCSSLGQATPAYWTAEISGCTGTAAVLNGTWTLAQWSTYCFWRVEAGPISHIDLQIQNIWGDLTVSGFVGANYARWKKEDAGCDYDGPLTYDGGIGLAAQVASATVTVTSVTA